MTVMDSHTKIHKYVTEIWFVWDDLRRDISVVKYDSGKNTYINDIVPNPVVLEAW